MDMKLLYRLSNILSSLRNIIRHFIQSDWQTLETMISHLLHKFPYDLAAGGEGNRLIIEYKRITRMIINYR